MRLALARADSEGQGGHRVFFFAHRATRAAGTSCPFLPATNSSPPPLALTIGAHCIGLTAIPRRPSARTARRRAGSSPGPATRSRDRLVYGWRGVRKEVPVRR